MSETWSQIWGKERDGQEHPLDVASDSHWDMAKWRPMHQHEMRDQRERCFIKHTHDDHFDYHEHTIEELAAQIQIGDATYRFEER